MKLFELTNHDETVSFSPFVWRAKMALAHKEIPVETAAWHFTDKEVIAPSGSKTVPVIQTDDGWVADSWAIACWLDDTYPDRPALFPGSRAEAAFITRWADATLVRGFFPMLAADVWDNLPEKDQPYFREGREAVLKMTLEEARSQRNDRRKALQPALAPMQMVLKDQEFLSGSAPAWADYAVFGPFQWARCISSFDPVDGDPIISAWRERMLDCHGGLARSAACVG